MEYTNTINTVNRLLTDEKEWVSRYRGYSEKIIGNQQKYEEGKKKFRVNPPLYLYTCIGNLIKNSSLQYDLRFLGQSIATIKVKNNTVYITAGKKKTAGNIKYFDINIPLREEYWNSYNANKFRKAFKKCKDKRSHSDEHRIESSLLSEFKKNSRDEKVLCNIQPVLLANTFFQMATPIKASKTDSISYSKQFGGGIDILSRVKHKDNSVRPCVMELKDEYSTSEPPEKVMKQAVAYGTFIARLLRSESGNSWYKLFGFSRAVPNELIVDVAIVMPLPTNKELADFNMEKLKVCENTYLELYTLYFIDNKTNNVNEYDYEFKGSLKDNMLP